MGNNLACISASTASSLAVATTTLPQTSSSDPTACRAYCTSGGRSFAYGAIRPVYTNNVVTAVNCYCTNAVVQPQNYDTAVGVGDNCAADDFSYFQTVTPRMFDTVDCEPPPTADQLAAFTTVASPVACFAQCRNYNIARIIPSTPANTFRCQCQDTRELGFELCAQNLIYSFANTVTQLPQISVVRRRRDRIRTAYERARKEEDKDAALCPAGLQPCRVGATSLAAGYECVDTQTELEACGGCVHGLFSLSARPRIAARGVDCTALEGAPLGAVTCTAGRCVAMACEDGYSLLDGECALA